MGLHPIVQDRGSQVRKRSPLYGLLPIMGRGVLAGKSYPGLPGIKGLELPGLLINNT